MRCARSPRTSRRPWTPTATIGAAANGPRSPWSSTATTSAPTAAAFRAIQRLGQQLGGQLRFVFRHFPLTGIHPHALAAAHLAEAAALQERFWPMHELLFHRQHALEDPDLLGYADQLGLDRVRLGVDLDGRVVWRRVQVDADSALASGARGTPTLFINGRLHAEGYDPPTLGAAVATVIKER
jgi:protein-disulfide isomerase